MAFLQRPARPASPQQLLDKDSKKREETRSKTADFFENTAEHVHVVRCDQSQVK